MLITVQGVPKRKPFVEVVAVEVKKEKMILVVAGEVGFSIIPQRQVLQSSHVHHQSLAKNEEVGRR